VGNTRQPCVGVATAPWIIVISFERVNFDPALYASGCHFAERTLELQPWREAQLPRVRGSRSCWT